MKNKKLKELLSQYPDDSNIRLMANSVIIDNIDCITIEYGENDDYTIPDIIIQGSSGYNY